MKKDDGRRRGRLAELARRGEQERARLADAAGGLARDVRRRRMMWKFAGGTVAGLAAAGTAAYKLFGKSSPAARIGKAASATSIVLGVGRAFLRIRRFL